MKTVDGERFDEGIPQRTGRALLHWINAADIRALFYAASVTTPATADALWAMWMRRQTPAGMSSITLRSAVELLPAGLRERETTIRASEQFRTIYEPLGVQFVSVDVANLVSPQ